MILIPTIGSFSLTLLRPRLSPLFPYTTLFRSVHVEKANVGLQGFELLDRFAAVASLGDDARNGREAVEQFERSEEHTSELQSHVNLVCRLLLEKKKNKTSSTARCSRACVFKST